MADTRISKTILRNGPITELPILDSAELGYATDINRLFIGNEELTVGTGDGTTTDFKLPFIGENRYTGTNLFKIFVDDNERTDITFDGTNITFGTAPANETTITIQYNSEIDVIKETETQTHPLDGDFEVTRIYPNLSVHTGPIVYDSNGQRLLRFYSLSNSHAPRKGMSVYMEVSDGLGADWYGLRTIWSGKSDKIVNSIVGGVMNERIGIIITEGDESGQKTLVFVYSDDNGDTWSETTISGLSVNTHIPYGELYSYPTSVGGDDDDGYIFYTYTAVSAYAIYTDDNGVSWNETEVWDASTSYDDGTGTQITGAEGGEFFIVRNGSQDEWVGYLRSSTEDDFIAITSNDMLTFTGIRSGITNKETSVGSPVYMIYENENIYLYVHKREAWATENVQQVVYYKENSDILFNNGGVFTDKTARIASYLPTRGTGMMFATNTPRGYVAWMRVSESVYDIDDDDNSGDLQLTEYDSVNSGIAEISGFPIAREPFVVNDNEFLNPIFDNWHDKIHYESITNSITETASRWIPYASETGGGADFTVSREDIPQEISNNLPFRPKYGLRLYSPSSATNNFTGIQQTFKGIDQLYKWSEGIYTFTIYGSGSVPDPENLAASIIYDYGTNGFSVKNQDDSPHSIFIKPDGKKLYMVGLTSDSVHQYTLSTAWDLSTLYYDNINFYVNAQDTSPRSVHFSSNGTKMFILGGSTDTVYQYTLSTAWDLSTASYDNISFDLSNEDNDPIDIEFKSDGTKMYVLGASNTTIFQYTLSSSWSISSVTYDNENFDVSDEDTDPRGIFIKSDGSKIYVIGNSTNSVYQYSLPTTWSLSLVVYDSVSISVSSEDGSPDDIFFKDDGTIMYMLGQTTDRIYDYDLSTDWDLSSASFENVSDDFSETELFPKISATGSNRYWTTSVTIPTPTQAIINKRIGQDPSVIFRIANRDTNGEWDAVFYGIKLERGSRPTILMPTDKSIDAVKSLANSDNKKLIFNNDGYTKTTPQLYYDPITDRLSIGNPNPSYSLDIRSRQSYIRLEDSDGILSGSMSSAIRFWAGSDNSEHGQVGFLGTGQGIMLIRNTQGDLYIEADSRNLHTNSAMLFRVDGTEAFRIDSDGNLGFGTSTPTTKIDIQDDTIRLRQAKTPSSATDTGNQGDICWDGSYIYVCIAANTWRRASLSTW